MQCTDLFNHVETPLVSTAMHWITEIADTVPAIDRNEKKPMKKLTETYKVSCHKMSGAQS